MYDTLSSATNPCRTPFCLASSTVAKPQRRRPGRPVGLAPLAALLLALLLLPAGVAQSENLLVPTYVHVQEAERVSLHPARAGDDLSWVTSLGLVEAGRLQIAGFEARDGRLDVVFRLAGSRPVVVDTIVLGDDDGRMHEVSVGAVAIHPAVDERATRLRPRVSSSYGDGIVLGAWLFENTTAAPVTIDAIAFAPDVVARRFFLARSAPDAPDTEAFEAWVATARTAILDAFDAPLSVPADTVEGVLREALPATDAVDPSAPGLSVPAGGSFALMLTRASLDVDLAAASLLLDVRVATSTADGGAAAQYLPNLARYVPARYVPDRSASDRSASDR